jgi:hypothetical protein
MNLRSTSSGQPLFLEPPVGLVNRRLNLFRRSGIKPINIGGMVQKLANYLPTYRVLSEVDRDSTYGYS